MLRTTTPEQARAEVKRLVRERGMTREQVAQLQAQAEQIAKALGV